MEHIEGITDLDVWDEYSVLDFLSDWELPNDWVFSPSQLMMYIQCPFSWFLKYGCRIKDRQTFLGSIIGSIFHKEMEKYYLNKRQSVNFKDISNIIKEEIDKHKEMGIEVKWNAPRTAEHIRLSEEDWHEYLIESDAKRIVEWINTVPKYDNAEVEKEIDMSHVFGFPYRGIVDLIGYSNGTKVLVDYKTTYASGWFKIDKYYPQLFSYYMALDVNHIEIPICFRALKDEPVSITKLYPTERTLEIMKMQLSMVVRGIRACVFPKMQYDSNFCKNVCQYRKICWGNRSVEMSV